MIVFSSVNELKQLKTPQTIHDGMTVLVIDRFYTYDVSGNQIMLVRGDMFTIDRAHDGYIIFNGSIIVDNADLKANCRPFAWTPSTKPGREKATIYPWK